MGLFNSFRRVPRAWPIDQQMQDDGYIILYADALASVRAVANNDRDIRCEAARFAIQQHDIASEVMRDLRRVHDHYCEGMSL